MVLSKTHLMEAPSNFSAPHFYQKLCANYPHAYVYFLQLPGVGCWLGATPEPLLTTENEIMHTVSLAGTHRRRRGRVRAGAEVRSRARRGCARRPRSRGAGDCPVARGCG